MSAKKVIITLNSLLKEFSKVENAQLTETNKRINLVMKETVRDFQQKQKVSIERSSAIVLNA